MARQKLTLVPEGWPCTLKDCPPGLFVYDGTLGLKTEYYANINGEEHQPEAYLAESGEVFHGDTGGDNVKRRGLPVQPVIARWETEDES